MVAAPAQQQPALAETMEVRLLEIEAVVTDPDGKVVEGLTQAGFELLENGTPQRITNLSQYRETATKQPSPAPLSAAPAAVNRPAPRTLVLLLDAIQLRGRPRAELFTDLRSLVDRTIRSGDRAQILTWTGDAFRPALDLTSDLAAVRNAVTTIEKNPVIAPSSGITMKSHEKSIRTRRAHERPDVAVRPLRTGKSALHGSVRAEYGEIPGHPARCVSQRSFLWVTPSEVIQALQPSVLIRWDAAVP